MQIPAPLIDPIITSFNLRHGRAKCVNFTHTSVVSRGSPAKNKPILHVAPLGTRIASFLAMSLLAGVMLADLLVARGQNVGERMWTPPTSGNFFPLSDINMPPIPWCPNLPIYYIGVLPGMNGPCYGY